MQESGSNLEEDKVPCKIKNEWVIYACVAGVLVVVFLLGSFYKVNQQQELNRGVVTDIHKELLESSQLKQEIGEYYESLNDATVFDPTYKKDSELADILVSIEHEGKVLALKCVYNVGQSTIEQITLNSDIEPQLEGKVIVLENKSTVTD